MGRPRKNIDPVQVYKLAQIGCSYREIAAKLGCDEGTIRKRFSAEKERGAECGNTFIRRWQMRRAQKGSDAMLIHLGMSRLGQTKRIDVTTEGDRPYGYIERGANPLHVLRNGQAQPNGAVHGNGAVDSESSA